MINEKTISIKCPVQNRIRTLVTLLNGVLKLTPRELEVVIHFLELDTENPCKTADRKKVIEKMRLKNVQTLNNIIKAITTKKVFIYSKENYCYCKVLQNIDKIDKIVLNVEVI